MMNSSQNQDIFQQAARAAVVLTLCPSVFAALDIGAKQDFDGIEPPTGISNIFGAQVNANFDTAAQTIAAQSSIAEPQIFGMS